MSASLEEPSLETLMEHYQQGCSAETAALIERLSPELLRFFTVQEATRSEAHDLLQETWLRVHRVRHTYRNGAPLLPWLFAIARRVRVDGFRKRSRINRNELIPEELPETAQPEPQKRALLPELHQMLAHLPEAQREVVILLKVNGLSLEEVAGSLGTTVGAVKQKASRAYAQLRKSLRLEGYGIAR